MSGVNLIEASPKPVELPVASWPEEGDYRGGGSRFTGDVGRIRSLNVGGYVNEIAGLFNVVPDPCQTYTFPHSVAFEDTTGIRDVFACVYDSDINDSVDRAVSAPVHLLRGLLEHRREIKALREGEPCVFMELMLSTRALNDVTRALGRAPGVDAFDFVRLPVGGRISVGDWIRGFAARQVLQSGLDQQDLEPIQKLNTEEYFPVVRWGWAWHDQVPNNHPLEWFLTSFSQSMFHVITDAAYEQEAQYGERLDDEFPPESAQRFVVAADRLDILIRPPYDAVSAIESASIEDLELILRRVRGVVTQEAGFRDGTSNYPKALALKAFNIMPPEVPKEGADPFTQAVFAEYACATAELFLAVDAIRPRVHEDHTHRAARVAAWRSVIEECTPLALHSSRIR